MKEVGFNTNKKTLPVFKNSWARLPEYLSQAQEEIQALQISSTAVGKITAKSEGILEGSPLVVGKKYYTSGIAPGDDFSNVGWVADEQAFIATGTTPNVWTTSNLEIVIEEVTLFFNSIDINLSANFNTQLGRGEIVITNNLFDFSKTYPVVENTTISVIDDNTLRASGSLDDLYFKIEVYV